MADIKLAQAKIVIDAALAHASELGLKPLCVAVLNSGGGLVAFQRQDNLSTLRPQIAIGKASSALALGVSSRKIGEMATERPAFIGALGAIATDGIIPVAGGLLIADGNEAIGAVGITGDTSDNDELCGLAGIAAAGLEAKG